jgi:hypothetical protein
VWGKLLYKVRFDFDFGFIFVRVGEIFSIWVTSCSFWVYSRMCGGNFLIVFVVLGDQGLFLHVWGKCYAVIDQDD